MGNTEKKSILDVASEKVMHGRDALAELLGGERAQNLINRNKAGIVTAAKVEFGRAVLDHTFNLLVSIFIHDEPTKKKLNSKFVKGLCQYVMAQGVAQMFILAASQGEPKSKQSLFFEFCADAVIFAVYQMSAEALNIRGWVAKIVPIGPLNKFLTTMKNNGLDLGLNPDDVVEA